MNKIMIEPNFKGKVCQGIPKELPPKYMIDANASHAPKRIVILERKEEVLAIRNALRYFPIEWHIELGREFLEELGTYGRIYMYRFKPSYKMYARPIKDYPSMLIQAAAIMMMIQ